eukprot:gb/GEZJ01009313.1/.p1 GENE.gb/GEZJ01009313.1/~~gb/GEZJ01009313.1/.p1  ORF type:complete len:109 (-),score=12.16 gb/GEZJ01009313.1/:113-439(-)
MERSLCQTEIFQGEQNNNFSQNEADGEFETEEKLYWDIGCGEEFLVMALGAIKKKPLYETVPYCARWRKRSGCYLVKYELIRRMYSNRQELGLFNKFLNFSYLKCVRN